MNRSKCCICGKSRNIIYLKKYKNLFNRYKSVCNLTVSSNNNFLTIGSTLFTIHPCTVIYFENLNNQLNQYSELFTQIKKTFPFYKIIEQQQNVAPELTFLLQIK